MSTGNLGFSFLQRTSPTCGPHTVNFQNAPNNPSAGAVSFNTDRKHIRVGVDIVDFSTTNNYVYRIETIHPTLNSVPAGNIDTRMLRVAVQTLGALTPVSLTAMSFNAKTATTAQVSGAKLYYTGTSTTFSSANQLGAFVAAPVAGNFNFTFNQSVPAGTHYF